MLSSPSARNLTAGSNHRASLQCPTTKHPCSAQPQSLRVSLQRPTTKILCSVQLQSIPAESNHQVSFQFLQCPATKYPSAQPPSVPAVPNPAVFLQCSWQRMPAVFKPTAFLQCSVAKSPCGAQPLQCRTPQMQTFADFASYNARLPCAHQ